MTWTSPHYLLPSFHIKIVIIICFNDRKNWCLVCVLTCSTFVQQEHACLRKCLLYPLSCTIVHMCSCLLFLHMYSTATCTVHYNVIHKNFLNNAIVTVWSYVVSSVSHGEGRALILCGVVVWVIMGWSWGRPCINVNIIPCITLVNYFLTVLMNCTLVLDGANWVNIQLTMLCY